MIFPLSLSTEPQEKWQEKQTLNAMSVVTQPAPVFPQRAATGLIIEVRTTTTTASHPMDIIWWPVLSTQTTGNHLPLANELESDDFDTALFVKFKPVRTYQIQVRIGSIRRGEPVIDFWDPLDLED